MKIGTLESMIVKETRRGKGSYKKLVFECAAILYLLNRHPYRTLCNSGKMEQMERVLYRYQDVNDVF